MSDQVLNRPSSFPLVDGSSIFFPIGIPIGLQVGEIGVTNFSYLPGDPRRYGAVGNGVAADDNAIAVADLNAIALNVPLTLSAPFAIANSITLNAPWIDVTQRGYISGPVNKSITINGAFTHLHYFWVWRGLCDIFYSDVQATFRPEWFGFVTVSGAKSIVTGFLIIPAGYATPFVLAVANRLAFQRMLNSFQGQNSSSAELQNINKVCILRPTVYLISTKGGNPLFVNNRHVHIVPEFIGEQFGPPRIFWYCAAGDGGQNETPLVHYAGMPAIGPLFLNATGECVFGMGIEVDSFPEYPATNTFMVVAGGIPDGSGGVTAVGSSPITAIRLTMMRVSGTWGIARVINCGSFNAFRVLGDGAVMPFSFEHGAQEVRVEHCRFNGHAFAPMRLNAIGIKLRSDGQPCAAPIYFHYIDNESSQSGLGYGGIAGGYCGVVGIINDANNILDTLIVRGNTCLELGNRQFSMLPGADPKTNYIIYGDFVSNVHIASDNQFIEWTGATTHFDSFVKIVNGNRFYMDDGTRWACQHVVRGFDLPVASRITSMLDETVTLATNAQFQMPNVSEADVTILETQTNLDWCMYGVSRLGTAPGVVIVKQNGTNYSATLGGVGYNLGVTGGVLTFENRIVGGAKTFRIRVRPWLTLD